MSSLATRPAARLRYLDCLIQRCAVISSKPRIRHLGTTSHIDVSGSAPAKSSESNTSHTIGLTSTEQFTVARSSAAEGEREEPRDCIARASASDEHPPDSGTQEKVKRASALTRISESARELLGPSQGGKSRCSHPTWRLEHARSVCRCLEALAKSLSLRGCRIVPRAPCEARAVNPTEHSRLNPIRFYSGLKTARSAVLQAPLGHLGRRQRPCVTRTQLSLTVCFLYNSLDPSRWSSGLKRRPVPPYQTTMIRAYAAVCTRAIPWPAI